MKQFRVELIFQGKGASASDPTLSATVEAQDETEALHSAKAELMPKHPQVNFSKVWCWHIEDLSSSSS